jgi:hypothetical protein
LEDFLHKNDNAFEFIVQEGTMDIHGRTSASWQSAVARHRRLFLPGRMVISEILVMVYLTKQKILPRISRIIKLINWNFREVKN